MRSFLMLKTWACDFQRNFEETSSPTLYDFLIGKKILYSLIAF